MRSESVNAVPLHCGPQLRLPDRLGDDVHLHSSKAFFEDGLDATEIEEVQSPLYGRDHDIDVAACAGHVAPDRPEYAGTRDPARLKEGAQSLQNLDGAGPIHDGTYNMKGRMYQKTKLL
jgi:hypothetical protein